MAYAFIFPASFLIFLFGLFPVAFAFFVSLHSWRRFPEAYLGLDNYYRSLGNFAFVLLFWTAIAMWIYGIYVLYRHWQNHRATPRLWGFIAPAILNGIFIITFLGYFFALLPYVLDVPRRLPRTEVRDRGKFINEFFNSFSFPDVQEAFMPMLLVGIAALVVSVIMLNWLRHPARFNVLSNFSIATAVAIGGAWLMQLTLSEIGETIQAAQALEEELPIWSQIIFISLGAACIGLAYLVWTYAVRQYHDYQFFLSVGAAFLLLMGGYLLVIQVPNALANADDQLMQGFWVTILYVIGTVPIQLSFGLGLAYLLFYIKKGKSLYRVMYFLPYITPFAATAVVFSVIFSNRDNSPINQMMAVLGIDSQKWLLEPTPINELIFGMDLPQIIEGPSLALVVIMIWSSWTYIGYDIVIFLAGLGNIPYEYYEAAQIDGASSWSIFRHITLPLLTPTTFFLSLIAIIGTFQAFTQIWIMRRPAAYDAVDTVGVYLFDTIANASPRYGYGAAMAFVLFGIILIITLFQNRLLGRRVFYG